MPKPPPAAASLTAEPPSAHELSSVGRASNGAVGRASGASGQQVVARSVRAARLHQPRVWGRGGAPSAFDVDSFFRDLEHNPVFSLTRRAFFGGGGVGRQTVFGTSNARFTPYRDPGHATDSADPQSSALPQGPDRHVLHSYKPGESSAIVSGSTVPTSTMVSLGPADSAHRSKLEGAHAAAARALARVADPGAVGVWQRATAHVLCALPRHYMYSRQWQALAATLGNLCFLTRLVALRGLEDTILTFTTALDALGDTSDGGDAALQAQKSLLLHRAFLCGLRDVRDADGLRVALTGTVICREALKAKLSIVSDLAHTIHRTIQTARRLLASAAAATAEAEGSVDGGDIATHIPHEIALEQCRSTLLAIASVGLLGVSDEKTSHEVIRDLKTHMTGHPIADGVLEARLASLDQCAKGKPDHLGAGGGAALAASSAVLLARYAWLPWLPERKHVRVCVHGGEAIAAVGARIARILRGWPGEGGAHLVRCEPLLLEPYNPRSGTRANTSQAPACTLCYVSCPVGSATDVGKLLTGGVAGIEWTEELESPPSFASLQFTPGPRALAHTADELRMLLTYELSSILGQAVHPHIVRMSDACTHVLVEFLAKNPVAANGCSPSDQDVKKAMETLAEQLEDSQSALYRTIIACDLRSVQTARATNSWLPPSADGAETPALRLTVCSNISDFAAERDVLCRWMLPCLQALLREASSDLAFSDLRHGGAEQIATGGCVGVQASLRSLAWSRLSLPGGHCALPMVVTLLGHHGGALPGEGRGQKESLRAHVGRQIESEVRWLRRALAPTSWAMLARRVGKDLEEGVGNAEAAGGLSGGLTYLEMDLAATWLASGGGGVGEENEEPEWGAGCEGVVLMRGDEIFNQQSLNLLPPSSQRALGWQTGGQTRGDGVEVATVARQPDRLRELVADGGGARVVRYESSVEGYECLVGCILAKVHRLKETLEMDLASVRGWIDGAGELLGRHRRTGLLRVSVDQLTIRQRERTAAQRAEIMGWWLLLKEEFERQQKVFDWSTFDRDTRRRLGIEAGTTGGTGRVQHSVELRRVVHDRFFTDMDGASSFGLTTGILDDDGFVCPATGNECVRCACCFRAFSHAWI